MATIMAPIIPPAAAFRPKALCTISTIAAGILVILQIRMTSAATTYRTAIKGTITEATVEILLSPPIITSATQMVRIIPAITTAIE